MSQNNVRELLAARRASQDPGTALATVGGTDITNYSTPGQFWTLLGSSQPDLYNRLQKVGITGAALEKGLTQANLTELQRFRLTISHLVIAKVSGNTEKQNFNGFDTERSPVIDMIQVLFLAFCINVQETESTQALNKFIGDQLDKIRGPALEKPPGHTKFQLRRILRRPVDTVADAAHIVYQEKGKQQAQDTTALARVMEFVSTKEQSHRERVLTALVLAHYNLQNFPQFIVVVEELLQEMGTQRLRAHDVTEVAIGLIGMGSAVVQDRSNRVRESINDVRNTRLIDEQLETDIREMHNYKTLQEQLVKHEQRLLKIAGDTSTQLKRNQSLQHVLRMAEESRIGFQYAQRFSMEIYRSHGAGVNPLLQAFDKDAVKAFKQFLKTQK